MSQEIAYLLTLDEMVKSVICLGFDYHYELDNPLEK